jgi:hypothetical protein
VLANWVQQEQSEAAHEYDNEIDSDNDDGPEQPLASTPRDGKTPDELWDLGFSPKVCYSIHFSLAAADLNSGCG